MDSSGLPAFVGQLIVVGQQVLVLSILKKNGNVTAASNTRAIYENAIRWAPWPPFGPWRCISPGGPLPQRGRTSHANSRTRWRPERFPVGPRRDAMVLALSSCVCNGCTVSSPA